RRRVVRPDAPAAGLCALSLHDALPIWLCLRRQGDAHLLVEYGELELDLNLRARVQSLLEALRAEGPPGLFDLTPGIRSLQIHFRSEEHTSELQSRENLVCRLLLEKKK